MSDAELIMLWQTGNQGAATALVERHSIYLRNMALRRFRVSDEVEELVQDVFVKAFEALGGFRGEKASLRTWLIVIMRRLILDRARSARRAEVLVPLAAADLQSVREKNALDGIIASETLDKAFASLDDPEDVRLVRMRLTGQSWRGIAKAFDANESTVKVRYHRLRLVMRKALAA